MTNDGATAGEFLYFLAVVGKVRWCDDLDGIKTGPVMDGYKENPALESLRVRTQPCTLTWFPVGISPPSAFFMLTADMMLWLISG